MGKIIFSTKVSSPPIQMEAENNCVIDLNQSGYTVTYKISCDLYKKEKMKNFLNYLWNNKIHRWLFPLPPQGTFWINVRDSCLQFQESEGSGPRVGAIGGVGNQKILCSQDTLRWQSGVMLLSSLLNQEVLIITHFTRTHAHTLFLRQWGI